MSFTYNAAPTVVRSRNVPVYATSYAFIDCSVSSACGVDPTGSLLPTPRTTSGKAEGTSGCSAGGRNGFKGVRSLIRTICVSRKLLMTDGARNALLKEKRTDWSRCGL